MIISSQDPDPIVYEDYDFYFNNGMTISYSIAKDLGDVIDFETSPMAVQMHFAEKPSNTDPEAKTPQEDITVLMQHVNMVTHRTRTVQPPSAEQRDLFKQTILKASRSVN